jgi:hypothetical protein
MFAKQLVETLPPIHLSAPDALYGRSKYLIPRTSREEQQFPRETSFRRANRLKRKRASQLGSQIIPAPYHEITLIVLETISTTLTKSP